MGFGAIMAKKRLSSPKSVYLKNCISGSQGRWTLGFCIEAIKSLTFDVTGHKVAKTQILSKWLTKLTHLCCVLSLF